MVHTRVDMAADEAGAQVAEMIVDAVEQTEEAIQLAVAEDQAVAVAEEVPLPPPPPVQAKAPPPKAKAKKGSDCPSWYKGADTPVTLEPLRPARDAPTKRAFYQPEPTGPQGIQYIPVRHEIRCANTFLKCYVGTPRDRASSMHTCPGCQSLLCAFCAAALRGTRLCWACTQAAAAPAPSLLDVEPE